MPEGGPLPARRAHRINSLHMTMSLPCAKGVEETKKKMTFKTEMYLMD